jgi:hypothetical protein
MNVNRSDGRTRFTRKASYQPPVMSQLSLATRIRPLSITSQRLTRPHREGSLLERGGVKGPANREVRYEVSGYEAEGSSHPAGHRVPTEQLRV